MSKNGEGYSSFIVSFVCFVLAYILKVTIVDRDPNTYIGPPPVLAFFGAIILTLIGVVTAFLGIAKRIGLIKQPDNSDIFR
tara:strand:+ start:754 stop:996 length:243 start_codon:yes stop_codon:yes gene_type:complete